MSINMNYKANVLCKTENMTEKEWLKWRTTGIGGSDAGTVMDVNPYRTRLELFFDKTGVKPVNEKEKDTLPLRWGHTLEALVAEEFSNKTGFRVYEVKEMYQHPLYPFMHANVDRFIELPDGTVAILECKTANPNSKFKWEDNSVPPSYECQVRHYMMVNIDVAYIACLFENSSSTMAIRKIERDLDIEEKLIAAEEDFWNNNVLANTPPQLTEDPSLCFETIDKYIKTQENKKPLTLTGFDEKLLEIAELKEQKKALEDEAKKLQEDIDRLLVPIVESLNGRSSGETVINGIKYTVKNAPSTRTSITKEALERMKFADRDTYDTYVSESVSFRRSFSTKLM